MADKSNNKESEVEDSLKEAQEVIIAHQKKIAEACMKEVNAILEKHGFALQVTPSQIMLTPVQKNTNGGN